MSQDNDFSAPETNELGHPVEMGLISEQTFARSHALAGDLFARGSSLEQVVDQLVASGIDERAANYIAEDALQGVVAWQSQPSNDVATVIGGVLILAGAAIGVGNLSGWFPTFPYLGTGIGVLGLLFFAGGRGRTM